MALTIPELGLLPVKHVTAQCRFRTVVIRTAVALFSHRCRIALLAFALLTFALLSLRTVGIRTVGFALVSFALLSFALLSYKPTHAEPYLLESYADATSARRANITEYSSSSSLFLEKDYLKAKR